jgi:putative transposase
MARTQTLAFPVRLPEAMQAGALRLLDASRDAINAMLAQLWPLLDTFAGEHTGPAWKQVEHHLVQRSGHGNRQERCEMEQAGRILRAQATRKQIFQTILPVLTEGLIRPAEGKRPALKDSRAIQAAVRALRADLEDAESFLLMTNVVEQACNVYLDTGRFPTTYEHLQPIPVQAVAQLTFAGDDGMAAGQTYRIQREYRGPRGAVHAHADVDAGYFWHIRLRGPNEQGIWEWWPTWHEIALPESVNRYLQAEANPLAPTLREVAADDGSRVAVLDVILEVPAPLLPPLKREQRVLGFDWGGSGRSSPSPSWNAARATNRIGRSAVRCFWTRGALTDGKPACAGRLTA